MAKPATVQVYDSHEKINSFLYDWIGRGSSVDIFSGQLSWVARDAGIRKLLVDKVKHQRVSVFMENRNKIARELERAGLPIVYYGRLKEPFGTRFTLLNRGEHGSQAVAIGEGVVPNFRISVYQDTEHPMILETFRGLISLIEKSMRPIWQEWFKLISALVGLTAVTYAVAAINVGVFAALGLGLLVGVSVLLTLVFIARLRAPRAALWRFLGRIREGARGKT